MNPRLEYGIFGVKGFSDCEHCKKKRSFEDMQNEMKKLNSDIEALNNMPLDECIKLMAKADLTNKRKDLLAEMHKELDRMYG